MKLSCYVDLSFCDCYSAHSNNCNNDGILITGPTLAPSTLPTNIPTKIPTNNPSFEPSIIPTTIPTNVPSVMPTESPITPQINDPTSNPVGGAGQKVGTTTQPPKNEKNYNGAFGMGTISVAGQKVDAFLS